ncbi:Cobalt-precorrin-5B (C(1))-methyltransferase [Lentibacillus sp. JNUCC-1]|uniref:ABC transporter ATP-binding protein n=1 Tax=Lentibacillus sp. JNUCC-1 TaxID=2654513 RepID=UPI0012E80AB2|nr:ABC transporter ATP-binding protein [Lentibacillus sp. JNUCC-1]MUV38123.1 Cobalt-precorrin-5B (C(1))-methyltransferase [Lentibacillus sp. JNUCC-1]
MRYTIETEGLAKTFLKQSALQSVDLRIEQGEIFGLLGPSGSGKTTTIKILTGQLEPTRGTAKVFGVPHTKLRQPVLQKRFGVVTDNSGLYDRLTVYDNLKLYCDLYDVSYTRINAVLETVNLTGIDKKRAETLSRGMKQRILIARALLHEPELLFLDEPTSALDPVNTQYIYKGLRALNAKGTTIMLTTHDMYEADTLCDRIAFLNEGTIQLMDTPENLKRRYADGTITVTLVNDEQVILPTGSDGADRLYDYMNSNQVMNIRSNEATIGDIFVDVTGRNLI